MRPQPMPKLDYDTLRCEVCEERIGGPGDAFRVILGFRSMAREKTGESANVLNGIASISEPVICYACAKAKHRYARTMQDIVEDPDYWIGV